MGWKALRIAVCGGQREQDVARGLNVVRMNMRNCGGTESLSPTLYHSGMSGDVAAVMNVVTARFRLRRVALVGYSHGRQPGAEAGGRAGREGASAAARGGRACLLRWTWARPPTPCTCRSTAFTSGNFCARCSTGIPPESRAVSAASTTLPAPTASTPCATSTSASRRSTAALPAPRTTTTAPRPRVCSSDIAVPTLILHALDDPFVRITPESRALIAANPHITLIETAHGGHCAFLGRPVPPVTMTATGRSRRCCVSAGSGRALSERALR